MTKPNDHRAIAIWLIVCAVMVLIMMVIGAVTRLSESGLSMVEWRPLIGWIPPMSDAEWQRVFTLYQQTSQYQIANYDMLVGEFKSIFWWEFIHRFWGRLIGLVFALPFLYFLIRRTIPAPMKWHLWALFILGGLQGVIGWWMVKSGFVERTEVSQYRLAIHLGMAFFILGYLLTIARRLLVGEIIPSNARSFSQASLQALPTGLIFITIMSGALVAGLNAGFIYNDWPLMAGEVFPTSYGELQPIWLNFFENIAAVQFNHRILAYITGAVIYALWYRHRQQRFFALNALAIMVTLQLILGISTLMLVIPLYLAVAHQVGAALTFSLMIWVWADLRART
jgi:cytochrome c oxidase assembly protein subunit 15